MIVKISDTEDACEMRLQRPKNMRKEQRLPKLEKDQKGGQRDDKHSL